MTRLSVQAVLNTLDGSRITKRMGNHFRHKVTVEWQPSGAMVRFAEGYCRLRVQAEQLDFECGADTTDDLQAIVETIDRHLPQFTSAPVNSIIWHPQ